MNILRQYIRSILVERGPIPKGPGTAWDEEEVKFKEEYEAMKAFQVAWKAAQDTYESNKSKKPKDKEPIEWPTWPGSGDKTTAQSGNKINVAVQKSLEKYKSYNPRGDSGSLAYEKKSGAKTEADKELPPKGKRVYLPIEDVQVGVWTPWPAVVKKSNLKYGSARHDNGETTPGIGPGEEWLSFIFGGQTQGASVSYDVVTPDGRTWEVKAIEGMKDTIRPGTHGLKVFEKPRQNLISVIRQLKNFTVVANKLGFLDNESPLNDDQKSVIQYAKNFLDIEYEMIVEKGEISIERFRTLRSILREIGNLKKQIQADEKIRSTKEIKTSVGLNDRKYNVDKSTFIDIAKKVERATSQDIDVPSFEIFLSPLKHEAFNDPTVFINNFFDSVDPRKVFSQTSGIFIVTIDAFMMIPKSEMKSYLRFTKVTQGKPRFAVGSPEQE